MNNENELIEENIFFKIANKNKKPSLFLIENIFGIVALFSIIGLSYLMIYNISQSLYINIILFLCIMTIFSLVILTPWIKFRLSCYTKLDNKEINSIYKTIEKDRNLVLKTNQLHRKQGFILEKQKDEILNEFYKKQEKIIEKHKDEVLD